MQFFCTTIFQLFVQIRGFLRTNQRAKSGCGKRLTIPKEIREYGNIIRDWINSCGQSESQNVLICVAGITPQVITETIYALSQKVPPIHIHKIYIITTSLGKKAIQSSLLQNGYLKALEDEYGLPHLIIDDKSFIIPLDENGRPLDDIKNEEENRILGNTIVSFIQGLTKDDNVTLHCSIAGGRKTMSFYLGFALQLFGRPQDKLYHVLVSPEFESNQSFFFKPKKNRIIEYKTPNNEVIRLNTDEAKIELAELLFIRLSGKISFKEKDFNALVDEGQRTIDTALIQPDIYIYLEERHIQIGSTPIKMQPNLLIFYNLFLKQKVKHCRRPERPYCRNCTDCFLTIKGDLISNECIDELAEDHLLVYRKSPLGTQEFVRKWGKNLSIEVVRQYISKINKTIREQILDGTLRQICAISCLRRYGEGLYGVRIEKGKINITEKGESMAQHPRGKG